MLDSEVLHLAAIETRYAQTPVLHGVSMKLAAGSLTALLGNNGAGKTTVLQSIMGLVKGQPERGTMVYRGQELVGMNTEKIVRLGIGYVPEGREVFPQLSVLENLKIGAWTRRDRAGIAGDLDQILLWFPRLKDRRQQLAGTLSGGEQQMLAMGRALMNRPNLLLLDEPSLGLSPRLVHELFELIRQIQNTGVTILLVEQNTVKALDAADYGYVLQQGRVALEGPSLSLKNDPRVQQLYFGAL